jgi:uncharacterized protein DUF4395
MRFAFGERIAGLTVDGTELHAAVFDENQVRAAAGLTMVLGAVAFGSAYFAGDYVLLQIVSTLFFAEFLIRVAIGLRYSPAGVVARALTRARPPDWVSAKPKRFAWTLGLAMSFSMMVITNSGIRGWLPRSICLVCLMLMWTESVLGVCAGCKLHGWLIRRGWTTKDPAFEVCAGGACAVPPTPEARQLGRELA